MLHRAVRTSLRPRTVVRERLIRRGFVSSYLGDHGALAAYELEVRESGLPEHLKARRREFAEAIRGIDDDGAPWTIGAIAPFVGLFGTVWGIMNSFIGISKAHTTNLAVVAPGIAEALLATALGLAAAIPAVVIYNYLARSIAGCKALFANTSTEVLNLTSRDIAQPAERRRAPVMPTASTWPGRKAKKPAMPHIPVRITIPGNSPAGWMSRARPRGFEGATAGDRVPAERVGGQRPGRERDRRHDEGDLQARHEGGDELALGEDVAIPAHGVGGGRDDRVLLGPEGQEDHERDRRGEEQEAERAGRPHAGCARHPEPARGRRAPPKQGRLPSAARSRT